MATLTALQINERGKTRGTDTDIAYATATPTSGGDEFKNTGVEFLRFENTDADTYTVTVVANGTTNIQNPVFGNITKSNVTRAVVQNAVEYLGPFHPFTFNDGDGKVQITYSGTGCCTNMTVEVLYVDQL